MYSAPPDLDRSALVGALRRQWGIDALSLDYLPVGFGSHHWEAVGADGSRWFVSADDLRAAHHAGRAPDDVFEVLDRAFRTAAALRADAGLEFVLAPIPSEGGTVLHRMDPRYAIRVEPFVDGAAEELGDFEGPEERRRMGTMLGRLHAASGSVPRGLSWSRGLRAPGPGGARGGVCPARDTLGPGAVRRAGQGAPAGARRRAPGSTARLRRARRARERGARHVGRDARRAAQRERHPGTRRRAPARGLGHDACRAARTRSVDDARRGHDRMGRIPRGHGFHSAERAGRWSCTGSDGRSPRSASTWPSSGGRTRRPRTPGSRGRSWPSTCREASSYAWTGVQVNTSIRMPSGSNAKNA